MAVSRQIIGCAWFSAATYDIAFGSLILIAAIVSLRHGRIFRTTPATLLGAGFASGFMGTLTAVGGPPMALVYQNSDGPTVRSTLNTYFAAGALVSIGVLGAVGQFGTREWWWSLARRDSAPDYERPVWAE